MAMVYEALLLVGPLLVLVFVYSFIVDFSDRADPGLTSIKRIGSGPMAAAHSRCRHWGLNWSPQQEMT
jgi:hypothetical protein